MSIKVTSTNDPEQSVKMIEQKEKKQKKEKKDKKGQTVLAAEESNLAGPSDSVVQSGVQEEETKEERKARKKAAKEARALKAISSAVGEASIPASSLPETSTATLPEATGDTHDNDVSPTPKRSKKSKRTREREERPLEPPTDMIVRPEVPVPAEESIAAPTNPMETNSKKDKKRKKQQTSVEVSVNIAGDVAEVDEEAKKAAKRAKHEKKARKALEAAQVDAKSQSAVIISEPSVVSKSTSPGEGIFADTSLSDQAKKGIFYAYQHSTSHLASNLTEPGKAWKFNKAKQGWLMRNVWSDVEIPDIYLDLIMGYLKTVQGAGRANLISLAKENSTFAPKTIVSKQDETSAEPIKTNDQESTKTSLNTEGAPMEPVSVEKTEDEKEEERRIQVRRERGEKLLKVLGAR